jgi:ribokinase
MPDVVVVGQVGRDLVLEVRSFPPAGGSTDVVRRREMLGGKGANQAVGLRQLGAGVGLVGVVGSDGAGDDVLEQARADGIDVTGVVRRRDATTALLLDVVEPHGVRRLLEDVPVDVLLRPDDVRAAEPLLRSARMVVLQLQQPGPAVVEALDIARRAGARVVADGAPADDDARDAVLTGAFVVRADSTEAALLVGRELDGVEDAVDAAGELLEQGPEIVALAVGTEANVVAWPGGHVVLPLLGGEAVDPTGGGDAFVAGLAAALLEGADSQSAGWFAAAAAASTVQRLGGRPDLHADEVGTMARQARADQARVDDRHD